MVQVGRWMTTGIAVATMQGGLFQPKKPHVNLESYLPKLAWDAGKKGPLIVVDPAGTFAEPDVKDLSSFRRKLSVCGSVSAIVPINMVLIKDDFPEHNLFDGLDNLTKVFFLLANMSPDQLQEACASGITPAELSGQTRMCLRSLIGHPFVYSPIPMQFRPSGEDEEVPESQLDRVGIKFSRTVTFAVKSDLKDVTYALSPELANRMAEPKGLYHRQSPGGPNFGFEPKVYRPNEQKKSDLNYVADKLTATVALAGNATVGDLVQAAGAASGFAIYADPRVASLPVESLGTSAKAGDLLRSLALAVTGTFRKVGGSYVLTSDLGGLGERQIRYWIWVTDGYAKIREKQRELVKRILESKALREIGYDSSYPYRPDGSMASSILESDDNQRTPFNSPSKLTSAQRTAFNAIVANPPNGYRFDATHVGVTSHVQYAFVLPDGRILNPEPGPRSATTDNFSTYVRATADSIDPMGRISVADAPGPRALMVRLEDAGRAPSIAKSAANLGFSELWIQTSNQAVLQGAMQAGLKVRFVADPWKTADALADPDRDMVGGLQGRKVLEESLTRRPFETLSPMDATLPSKWEKLKSISALPNLAGLVVTDTQPPGYEKQLPAVRRFGHQASESLEFGYSTAEREAFLKQFGVDPIDITMAFSVGFDITQPFFESSYVPAGPRKSDNWLMSKLRAEWTKFRSSLNDQCSARILDTFRDPSHPPLIQLRRASPERSPNGTMFTALTPNRALADLFDKGPNDVQTINIPFTDAEGYAPDPNLPPTLDFSKKPGLFAFDLRRVPQEGLLDTLRQWFVRPKAK